jgi:NADH:ubiquinone oxidoreductase subunit
LSQHKEQQGFVTFAQNTADVDYLNLAYLQALNIKATQRNNRYAVIVDTATREKIDDRHHSVFDYIVDIPHDYNDPTNTRKFANEWQAFWLTPFKETIKLESDLLFTRTIDHWWTAFRLRNVCLSTGTKNFKGLNSTVRKYRELFDENNLPDVYNGLMYFRYSREAMAFFEAARYIQQEWSYVKTGLKRCFEDEPSTDVLYSLAALMVGEETCTIPSMDFINFVHMKPGIQGWSDNTSWIDTVVNERDGDVIRINNLNQYNPVHYYDKSYATQELIEYYESRRN